MIKRLILRALVVLGLTAGAVFAVLAVPASASTACNGSSSCDETLVTQNNAAQFILNSYNCISSTNHDIDGVTVYNNASDHARHSYVVQARQELPSNSLITEKTIFVDWQHSVNVQMGIASRPKGNHLYTYVRDGNGVEQRLSVWHAEGDYPTWATATTLIYPYNTYSCL
jgi:hypothetical protein